MAKPYAFISYKHADPTTGIADHLYQFLLAVSDGAGFDVFMDHEAIRPGDSWKGRIGEALDRTTHFFALLDTAYWLSPQCRRELRHALNRWETSGSPRLLFVMAGEIRPDYLSFDSDRKTGEMTSKNPKIKKVGDIHFLGPFDTNGRLVALDPENPVIRDRQIGKLFDQFVEVLDDDRKD